MEPTTSLSRCPVDEGLRVVSEVGLIYSPSDTVPNTFGRSTLKWHHVPTTRALRGQTQGLGTVDRRVQLLAGRARFGG